MKQSLIYYSRAPTFLFLKEKKRKEFCHSVADLYLQFGESASIQISFVLQDFTCNKQGDTTQHHAPRFLMCSVISWRNSHEKLHCILKALPFLIVCPCMSVSLMPFGNCSICRKLSSVYFCTCIDRPCSPNQQTYEQQRACMCVTCGCPCTMQSVNTIRCQRSEVQ